MTKVDYVCLLPSHIVWHTHLIWTWIHRTEACPKWRWSAVEEITALSEIPSSTTPRMRTDWCRDDGLTLRLTADFIWIQERLQVACNWSISWRQIVCFISIVGSWKQDDCVTVTSKKAGNVGSRFVWKILVIKWTIPREIKKKKTESLEYFLYRV